MAMKPVYEAPTNLRANPCERRKTESKQKQTQSELGELKANQAN